MRYNENVKSQRSKSTIGRPSYAALLCDFKYLENPEITGREAINDYTPDSPTGFFLEVDLVSHKKDRHTAGN